ncbi:MAG: cupin domain-containing protein [Bacteroidales bacterium]
MSTADFTNGELYIDGESIEIESLPWNDHPAYKGVSLKHVIKGESTSNQLSCHIVRINPGCVLELHCHAGKTELHEVIKGSGTCRIEESRLNYQRGSMGFIPADKNHSVEAGAEGLVLLAKFFPALL